MEKYYANSQAQKTGEHEVHRQICDRLPLLEHRIDLGRHMNCDSAMKVAKKKLNTDNVDGCAYCCPRCNKENRTKK